MLTELARALTLKFCSERYKAPEKMRHGRNVPACDICTEQVGRPKKKRPPENPQGKTNA